MVRKSSGPKPEKPHKKISVRLATKKDAGLILSFIRELAAYEKLSREVVTTEKILAKNLFHPKSSAECLIAEVNGQPAGYALFYRTFSTFLGKPGIYLEDLYIKPAHRGGGIGKRLLKELAKIVVARDYGRLEWSALDWNEPALAFYRKLGAGQMTGWIRHRLNRKQTEQLARQKT